MATKKSPVTATAAAPEPIVPEPVVEEPTVEAAAPAPKSIKHPSGLDKGARERVREIIDEWEDKALRTLPFAEHLRELVAEKTPAATKSEEAE